MTKTYATLVGDVLAAFIEGPPAGAAPAAWKAQMTSDARALMRHPDSKPEGQAYLTSLIARLRSDRLVDEHSSLLDRFLESRGGLRG